MGGGRDEDAGVFAPVATGLPLLACLVPESFPLGREVTITGGDAEEEGVIGLEGVGSDERNGGGLAGCVHFGEDFAGEGFLDSGALVLAGLRLERAAGKREEGTRWDELEDVCGAAGSFNAGFLCFG